MQYLSQEWLDAAHEAVTQLPPNGLDLRIGYRILNGPPLAHSYTLVLGPGPMGIEAGVNDVVATLIVEYSDAVGIAKGEINAQRAVLEGHIIIEGEVTQLLGAGATIEQFGDCLGSLRDRTEF